MSASFLFQLREAARTCPNELTRFMLRQSADQIAGLINKVGEMPSIANFQELNGAVAKAVRTLGHATEPAPTNASGGAMPLPEKLAA